jgi:hypothetical protein
VVSNFLDQVHDPQPHPDVGYPHERCNERQPVTRCHEISQWIGRRPAGEGVASRRALEEERHGHLQSMANLLEPARADPVSAFFVFLDLLERDVERIAEFRLAHVQHHSAHTHAGANMLVYVVGQLWRAIVFFSQEIEHTESS